MVERMITERQMGLAMPAALAAGRISTWYGPLVAAMERFKITTPTDIQFFLANIAEETGQLQARSENLHYSGDRLLQVFPSLFDGNPAGSEKAYELAAAGPEAIANFIYADVYRPAGYRMGNTQPGDGWKYRGRGPMQTTGGDNYRRFFRSIGLPENSDPDMLLEPKCGAMAAAQFWSSNGCSQFSEAEDFQGVVQRVNGGLNGFAARKTYLGRFVAAMANPDPTPKVVAAQEAAARPMATLEPLPPVLTESFKPLPPKLEPVPPMAPVPPPGFSVAPTGNVVRDNVEESTIVKASKIGQGLVTAGTGIAAVGTAAAAARDSFKGLFGHIDPLWFLSVTVIGILLSCVAWFYFRTIKNDRKKMNADGIA